MRLLNIYTLQFSEFSNDSCPPYITASHRWSNDETTHQDVKARRHTDSLGYKKLEAFCAVARKDNESLCKNSTSRCEWIWSDSSCIDKTSSAEVTESINSMFTWYRKANHCLAYLADVQPLSAGTAAVLDDFERSEWFKRGWTLQELLAPPCVTFLTSNWEVIGHKCSSRTFAGSCAGCCQAFNVVLNQQIAHVTGIPEDILWNYEESKKLRPKVKWSWTENRKTTRPEDAAYCLLGIFNVYMPLIYGEGAENASIRLKQEIAKRNRGRSPGQRRRSKNDSNGFWDESSGFPFRDSGFFNANSRKNSSGRSSTASESSDKENIETKSRSTHRPEASFFSFDNLAFPFNMSSRKTSFSSSKTAYDDSDQANPETKQQNWSRRPNAAQTAAAGNNFSCVDKAALAGVSPAQIACAGRYLPDLDLALLSGVQPAQIAAAGKTLPDWDLSMLAGLTPAQINAAAKDGRTKQRHQRRRAG